MLICTYNVDDDDLCVLAAKTNGFSYILAMIKTQIAIVHHDLTTKNQTQ